MRFVQLAAVSALLVAASAGADDLTIVAKRTRGDAPPVATTSYYTSSKFRTTGGDGQEVIADLAGGTMTMIDSRKKEYTVITPKDMDEMAAQMDAQQKEMEAKMQNLPPAVREKMAGMMGGMMASVEVTKAQGGRTIAGHSCQNWIVTMGQMMKQELCVASDIPIPPGTWDAMKRFATGMSGGAHGPMAKGMSTMFEKMKEMKGIPLLTKATVSIMGRSDTTTTEVTDVKTGPVPASAFDVPADYKKVDFGQFKGGHSGRRG